jgi:hypothetical protein
MKTEKGIVKTFSAVADGTELIVKIPGSFLTLRFNSSVFVQRLAEEIRMNGVECSEEAIEKLADEVA